MRILVVTLLSLLAFSSTAAARTHHHKAVEHTASPSCYRTDDIMHPCFATNPSFFGGIRSIDVKMHKVSSRKERRARAVAQQPSFLGWTEQTFVAPARAVERGVIRAATSVGQVIGGRPSGCPHAYCGCGTSLHVFGKIVPELNLALNWRRFPSASPAPGMVAYRSGHVFAIESVNSDGTVIAYDSNSGRGLTRVHTVSLRGYRVVNPHG